MAFVPLVAFDRKGFRIGYGKGYYDRYLKRCRPSIPMIGFSFFDPVERIRDINEFDVPLSLCITPSGIYEF
jgi:5-formyltetrahydrofolate cyclo-ligase